ncbi:MAG: hypothetical protein QM523_02595 [Candidatus Pacebacteria bacterium]|nr:hypothetical protein [Candidatus Paceibacterota bacterium]
MKKKVFNGYTVSKLDSIINERNQSDFIQVGNWLLEETLNTQDDLTRSTDDNYTRGTTAFGRQKNRILIEYNSQNYKWLRIHSNTNDLVFSIHGTRCRFASDDFVNPKKNAVLFPNEAQLELLPETRIDEPDHFCYIITKLDFNDESSVDFDVIFAGLNRQNKFMFKCSFFSNSTLLPIEAIIEPPPVEVEKPMVEVKTKADSDNKINE